jgi:circadian clock protein KaiC
VLTLEQLAMQYGADRRRLRVAKLRGSPFRSGYHDFLVQIGGLKVFPRLIASEHRTEVRAEPISSDVKELDAMMSGGIDRSTCTLLIGPAGCGKSALASQFALAAARRGEHATLFLFEERIGTWMRRGEQLGMALKEQVDAGRIHVKQVDPAELAPDEFAHLVRDAVERDGSRVVVIDSMTGYFTAMPEARFLSLQMHELLAYLSEHGVASVLTVAQSGMIGNNMTSAVDLSYLADTIVVLRYFEALGHLKKAVSVLKKRSGSHEDAIREIELGPKGIRVGKALSDFHGIFTGVPRPLANYGEGNG